MSQQVLQRFCFNCNKTIDNTSCPKCGTKNLPFDYAKYIYFFPAEIGLKTVKIDVFAKESNDYLGQIKWFFRWRQYSFFPNEGTVYEKTCLNEISDYLKKLNVKHRQKNTTDILNGDYDKQ